MNDKNKSVEEIYVELEDECILNRLREDKVSEYHRHMWEKLKDNPRHDCKTLAELAARMGNYNPGRSGIGEKAQIRKLQAHNAHIKKIPNGKENSISLHKDGDTINLYRGRGKSNLPGIKNFDAHDPSTNSFLSLKTIDMSPYSSTTGGGGQDNVMSELALLIDASKDRELTFEGRPVKLVLLIDGRGNDKGIERCRKLAGGNPSIFIGTTDEFIKSNYAL